MFERKNLPLLSATVKVKGIEPKVDKNGKSYSRLLADDDKSAFTVFHTKKDGTETQSYNGLQRVRMGETVEVVYTEEVNGEKTYRTAMMITPVSDSDGKPPVIQYDEGANSPTVARKIDVIQLDDSEPPF